MLLLIQFWKASCPTFAAEPNAARQPSVYPARLVFRQRDLLETANHSLGSANIHVPCLIANIPNTPCAVAERLLGRVSPLLLLLLVPQLLHSSSSKLRGLMVSTRQKSASICWLESMQQAARLPDGVVMQRLDCCCRAACLDSIDPQQWSMGTCSSTFADLDRLRRVSTAFNQRISHNTDFLQLLCCEKLRALERKTWGKRGRLNQKKLPASFTLPFLSAASSADCITHARFHLLKTPKSPQHLQVEARHKDSTPSQVSRRKAAARCWLKSSVIATELSIAAQRAANIGHGRASQFSASSVSCTALLQQTAQVAHLTPLCLLAAFCLSAPVTCLLAQVLQLLQLMCYLEGRITGMLYIIAWRRNSSPTDWIDRITTGARNITHPVPVRTFERDEWVGLYPDNQQFVTRLAPRA